MSGAAQAVALIPPAMAPPKVGDIQEDRADSPKRPPICGVFWRLGVNGALIERVVQYDVEVDSRSFWFAAAVIFFSHIGAFHVEKNAASPRLPYSKEHFVLNLAPIAGNHFDGKEIAVSALIAPVGWQLRDNTREQFGKFPPAGVEDAAVTLVVETQCQIVCASVSRKAACEAMITKSDVDAELFGESLAFRRPFERSGIGSKVLEIIDLLGAFELVPIHRLQYEGQRA
jgi:hypothetical protein